MPLAAIVEKLDDVPEAFRELYSERNGKFEFTGVTGLKTQADIDRLSESLTKERSDHKTVKQELATVKNGLGSWSALKPEEIAANIDGYDALKLAAESAGNVNAEEVGKRVQAELSRHTAPLERKIKELGDNLGTATEQIVGYQGKDRQRAIHDAVRKARIGSNVRETAEDDVLLLAEQMFDVGEDGRVTTKDGVGVTPGVEPDVWLTEMQPKRPHWWPDSFGGGSKGGNRNGNTAIENPWGPGKLWNITKQMAYVKEHGEEKAAQLAGLAGSHLGATAPTKA